MSTGRMPRPYLNDVPANPDPMTVIVNQDTMGIGARRSGLPKTVSTGPGALSHVGGSAGKKG